MVTRRAREREPWTATTRGESMRPYRLAIPLLVALLVGCGDAREGADTQQSADYSGSPGQEAPPMASPPKGAPESAPPGTPPRIPTEQTVSDTAAGGGVATKRQIIRSGTIELVVASLDTAERSLSRLVQTNDGFIASSSRERRDGSTLDGTVEVRVPSARFEALLDGVRRLGRVESESISSSDVTEEYIDLEARLKGQQELEARLLKLLAERPGKLGEIVEIEQKLAEVRATIEGIQGRLRYLSSRVALSTLTVRMTEPGAIGTSDTETFGGRIRHAIDEGVDGLVELLSGIITLVLATLPLLLVGALVWMALRRRRRARVAASTPLKRVESTVAETPQKDPPGESTREL